MDKPREKMLRYFSLPPSRRREMLDFHGEYYVCVNCFRDQGLRDYIIERAVSRKCDFCRKGSRGYFAAPLVEIASYIEQCLLLEYDEALNCLSWDSEEDDYIGEWCNTHELLTGLLDFPNDRSETLLDELIIYIGDKGWCKRNPYGMSTGEILQFSWEDFVEKIKYKQRYFFIREIKDRYKDDLLSAADILERIAKWVAKFGLVVDIPKGTRFFRARYQSPGETLTKPSELGPPPRELATQANRMSPPGIVMLYVSDDAGTALRETASGPGAFVVGEFETDKSIRILDLTKLPDIPSLFEPCPDSLEYNARPILIFLHTFAVDMAKQIARDDRVHIEYVPTQVVTEFFRTEYQDERGNIDGLRYPSSRHSDHSSLVLFASQDDIYLEEGKNLYPTKPWLRLVDIHRVDVTQEDLDGWEI